MLDELYIFVQLSLLFANYLIFSGRFLTCSRQPQASCSSYNSNVSKVQTNECKQGAARVKGALKCWPCTKNPSIVRPANCYTLKIVTGPFKITAPVRAARETGPGLLVPQVRSNTFLRLQENNPEYKMQMYFLYIW